MTERRIASRFVLLMVGAVLLCPPAALGAQVPARDSAWLVTTSQALVDAVTDGDSAVWSRHLAPEWFLSDEAGEHLTRAEFLAALHPLPPGQEGKLTVTHPYLVGSASVAVISYDAEEEHSYYGQRLLTTFHVTDTWVRRRDRWLQLASQVTALPRSIDGITLDRQLLQDYAGVYRLTPEITLTLVVADSGLAIRRAGRPDEPLFALDDRIFIRHGIRGFWVFERDGTGRVVQVVDWRDHNPVRWTRVR